MVSESNVWNWVGMSWGCKSAFASASQKNSHCLRGKESTIMFDVPGICFMLKIIYCVLNSLILMMMLNEYYYPRDLADCLLSMYTREIYIIKVKDDLFVF